MQILYKEEFISRFNNKLIKLVFLIKNLHFLINYYTILLIVSLRPI